MADSKAAKRNPALEALAGLVGEWRTVGKHPYLPGRELHGTATFAWQDGGAYLRMQTTNEAPEIPDGIAIFGSDDGVEGCFMLYFDERDVSRKYDVRFEPHGVTWERHDPTFSQRFTITVAADGASMRGVGEMSKDGGPWEPDLQLDYTRL